MSTHTSPSTASSRDRILACAVRLFADQGFAATSVKQIAREAGVAQGAMYTYFASKDELLREIFDLAMADVRSTFAADADRDIDPLDAIEHLIVASFQRVEAHADVWRIVYAMRTQPVVLARLGIDVGASSDAIERELAALCERAGLEHPEVEAKLLFAFVDGANQHRALVGRPYPVEAIVDAFMAKYRAQRGRSS